MSDGAHSTGPQAPAPFLLRLQSFYLPDLRALALMRIGVSLVVITDLVIRWSDLSAHYTDAGTWPAHLAQSLGWREGYWSLHTLSGSAASEHLLFAIHAVAALALLTGYRTKLSACVTWLLYISLHNRNLFILQAGDDLLRICIFWMIFLPCGARYSVDARRRTPITDSLLLPAAGYFLLVASVYLFTFILKSGEEWRNGDAIYFALSLEQMRLPLGDLLYRNPLLMQALTWTVLALECVIPILILWPSASGKLRGIAFVLIVILHTGIGLTLYVGMFFLIGIATALALVPPSWMDRIESFLPETNQIVSPLLLLSPILTTLRDVMLISVVTVSLAINIASVPAFPYEPGYIPRYFAGVLRVDQFWGMFSPGVLRTDGWFVYEGIDMQGNAWDLREGKQGVSYEKPDRIVSHYQTDRWRKLAENLQSDRYSFLRPCFSDYILDRWNAGHPGNLMRSVSIYFMERPTQPGHPSGSVRKRLLHVSVSH